jgi:signal recognition particle subunit SRP54
VFDSLANALSSAYRAIVGNKVLTEGNVDESIKAIRQALLEADVNFKVAKEFIADVKTRALGQEVIKSVDPGQQFVKVFHDALTDLLGGEAAGLPVASNGPLILMMAGLQGSGKTTTCAKLALHLRRKKKKNPLLVAADLQRPAAVDQLVTLGKQLGIPVHSEPQGAKPTQVCQRGIEAARKGLYDVVILDTAGRLHVDDQLMTELQDVHAKCQPQGVILVCDAMLGQDAVNSALEFHKRLPIWGVILTKVDGDARGGAALSIKKVIGRPILFAGVGEKPDDLEEFDPSRMAGRILGMGDVVGLVEKAQEVIDEKEAEKAARKLARGQLNFEDFMGQMNMIRKLGPMKKVLGMIPGIGSALKDIDVDDKHMKRVEAIMHSMTVAERRDPDLLDVQRRRRIALGSGNELAAVNELIKNFKMMQKAMAQLSKGGMGQMKEMMKGLGGGPGGGPGGLGGLGGLGGPGGGFPGGKPGKGGNNNLRDFLGGRGRR